MNKQYIIYAVGVIGIIFSMAIGVIISPYILPKQIELVPWIVDEAGDIGGDIRLYSGDRVSVKEDKGIYIYYLGTNSIGDSYFRIYAKELLDYTIIVNGIRGFNIKEPDKWNFYFEIDITAFGKSPLPWVELTISERLNNG